MYFLKVIDNILSDEECKILMNKIDNNKNSEHIANGSFANYKRIVLIDNDLCDVIFNRIKHLLPNDKTYKRCNEYFRIAKYNTGGEFKIHRDGINQDKYGNRSYLTLNIFLNDNLEGGETDFYNDDKSLRLSVKPKTGTGALFYSQQLHSGNIVKKGNKYLLRTDIMI